VDELDGDARNDRRCAARRCGEVHELRAQPFAACGERLGTNLGDDASIGTDRMLEPFLEIAELGVEARRVANLGRCAHRTAAVCKATIPPANSRT